MSKTPDMIKDLKKITEDVFGHNALVAIDTKIKTGIDILDLYAGGGFALGTFETLAGMPHSGKSTLAIQIAANVQKEHPDSVVIYFDSENAVTEERLASLGIERDRLIYVSSDITIESIFRVIDKFIVYKEKHDLVDVPYVIIWDSLAITPSEKVLSSDEVQNTDGMVRAKFIAEYLPRYLGKFKKYNIMMLTINQLREKMQLNPYGGSGVGLKGMGNFTMPGGAAVQYASFHLLIMKPKEILNIESYGFQGAVVECVFVKNKLARPLKPFYLVLDVDRGFSNFWSYYYYMKQLKILTTGAWNSLPGYSKKFRTKEAFELYANDEEFRTAFNKAAEQVLHELEKDIRNESMINVTINDEP